MTKQQKSNQKARLTEAIKQKEDLREEFIAQQIESLSKEDKMRYDLKKLIDGMNKKQLEIMCKIYLRK